MKKIFFLLLVISALPCYIMAQDEILLTIDNQPVYRSEFERIYHKNSSVQGYESKPPAEYLDMFINFKLKVLEAKNMGLDTLSSFITELSGYREQLSKPYLQDRDYIEQLIKEAYYRTINEVNASHIMVKLPEGASPVDTIAAYNKAMNIRKRLVHGESFDIIAGEESEDPSGKINKGRLGWFSAFTMVYPFENAAYKTPVDSFSMPVRSRYGYHIIRVNKFRPALGEIKLAHIMVYAGANEPAEIIAGKKGKIDSCYTQLKNGSRFADMVMKYSEDPGALRNQGQMRWLRSGELPSDIEEVVFSLGDSGAFTVPVQSEYGWHIFELQGKRPIAPLDQIKSQLEERIMMDERGKKTQDSFIEGLKKEYGFIAYTDNSSSLAAHMDSSVYNGKWALPMSEDFNKTVFSFNNINYTQRDLAEFISKTKRYSLKDSYQAIIERKLRELVQAELMTYEKSCLEEKYPNFRYLMDEYHDGILLFNIMDATIWTKSVSDSAGLRAFYNLHANDYQWKERADISLYILDNPTLAGKTLKLAKKRAKTRWPVNDFLKMVCPGDSIACISVTDQKVEKGSPLPMTGIEWKKGYAQTIRDGNKVKILLINDILPPSVKKFDETQGQVTADYQNTMDKEWIEALRNKYPVVINDKVFEQVK